jgi:REP element-mobilizing transposase RayT
MKYRRGSHSLYDLKYHVVFCTKCRFRVLTGQVSTRARELIREVCSSNYIDIISGTMSPDHVHLLISVPPSISLSKTIQYIKGKVAENFCKNLRFCINDIGVSIFGLEAILRLLLVTLMQTIFNAI